MTDPISFNLLEEPWIPCIKLDGVEEQLSMRQTLAQAHKLRALSGDSPLEKIAIHRLVLAILHRVFGPDGYQAWSNLWERGSWDMTPLDAYFDRWRDRFDLLHPERPFYQSPDPRVKSKSVINLYHDMASGNNPTLFDHHTESDGASLTLAEAARALVSSQTFGLAGLSGIKQKFTDGTCARGVIFLVEGSSLFQTLTLNLVRYPDEQEVTCSSQDMPAWEMDDPFFPDRGTPYGYLDYLTWQNRRIMLHLDYSEPDVALRTITMGPALRLDPGILDPFKHYRRDKKAGWKLLRFNENRALWRDSAALFSLHMITEQTARPPATIRWLRELVEEELLDRHLVYRFGAYGMANYQATVYFFREERLPLPLAYLRKPERVQQLQEATELAEATGRQLWGATRTLAAFIITPEADLSGGRQPARQDLDSLTEYWDPERHYWVDLELPFRSLLVDLPSDPSAALASWRQVLRRTAWQAFDRMAEMAGDDSRALKATVQSRRQLGAGLKKVFSYALEEVTV